MSTIRKSYAVLFVCVGTAVALAGANAVVAYWNLAPAVIIMPTTTVLGLTPTETATFTFDPDPEIRWGATDSPRTLGDGPLHIGLLGDSEAYGYCVGRDYAPDQALVAAARGLVTVTNYGVSGYDAEQNAAVARRYVPTASLDVLVWIWNFNDMHRNTYNALMVPPQAGRVAVSAEQWAIRTIPLYRLLVATWMAPDHAAAPIDMVKALSTVATLGVPVLLVHLPEGPGGAYLPVDLAPVARSHGMTVLPPEPWVTRPENWCEAGHLSRRGNELLAQDILMQFPQKLGR